MTTSALATLGSTAATSLFSSHALGKTAAPVQNADAPIAGQIATLNTQNSTYRERAETCEAAAREERERYLRIGPSCSGNDAISANRTHLVEKLNMTCYELGKTEERKSHFVKRVEECEIEKGRLQQSESKSTAALPSGETTAEEINSIVSSITDEDTKKKAAFLAEAAVAGEQVITLTATYDAVDVAAPCAMLIRDLGIDPSNLECSASSSGSQAKVPTPAPADPSSSGKAGRRLTSFQRAIEISILTTETEGWEETFDALESAHDASTGQAQDPMHILENIPGIRMDNVNSLQKILQGALEKHEDYYTQVVQCDAEKEQLQAEKEQLQADRETLCTICRRAFSPWCLRNCPGYQL